MPEPYRSRVDRNAFPCSGIEKFAAMKQSSTSTEMTLLVTVETLKSMLKSIGRTSRSCQTREVGSSGAQALIRMIWLSRSSWIAVPRRTGPMTVGSDGRVARL